MKNLKKVLVGNLGAMVMTSAAYASIPASMEYLQRYVTSLNGQIDEYQTGPLYHQGPGISITGSSVNATSTIPATHYLGELYGDGIVFWLDPTTSNKGLIAAVADEPGTYQWSTANSTRGASGDGAYKGVVTYGGINGNTFLLTSATYPAGNKCATKVTGTNGGTLSGWYLPSISELIEMHWNRGIINKTIKDQGFTTPLTPTEYWSSTEWATAPSAFSWVLEFQFNHPYVKNVGAKTTELKNVRCVRAF